MQTSRPTVAITMGDVAGIGPEIIVKLLADPETARICRPVVIGDAAALERDRKRLGVEGTITNVVDLRSPEDHDGEWLCRSPSTVDVSGVQEGTVDGRAGRAAHDWLVDAIDLAKKGDVDAIVTAPLNKAAMHAGGISEPGHTEILARECGLDDFAMMLYLPESPWLRGPHGLAINHVTLHTSIESVPRLLTTDRVVEKIRLIHDFQHAIGNERPRIGICALNPHGGEGGLFGSEEAEVIAPAVERSRGVGIDATGPEPADTLIRRATHGEFDGVVAMYHDQGHIAMKLIGFDTTVNVTLGLPIIRTSPSHGTAFDRVGRGTADVSGLRAALRTAVQLVAGRRRKS